MATVRAVRLYRQADQLMVALFGEPSAVADGWLENLPAEAVFDGPVDVLPLEQTLPIEQVRALVPLRHKEPKRPLAALPLAAVLRLGHRLPGVVSEAALAALADRCLEQQRPDLALPLLDALAEDPRRRLAAAQCRLALGQVVAARDALELLAADPAVLADPELAAEVLDCTGWALLQAGRMEPAAELIERLGAVAGGVPGGLDRLDRLARVLSTIGWLESMSAEAIGCSRDLRPLGGPMIALDGVQMSRCGAITLVNGWLLDPSASIESLVLLRGRRARRLSLAEGQRRPRGDLQAMLAEMGQAVDSQLGFQLWAVDGVEEAEPPQEGELAGLFVVTASGEQCCLGQPIELIDVNDAARQMVG
jgi:hypothetical protein